MTAREQLSRPQFHGARMHFDDTHVRPPSQTGATSWSSSGYSSGSDRPAHTDLAFATDSEHVAWGYARVVPHTPDHPVNNDPDPKYRSRVLTVGRAPDQTKYATEIESQKGFPITGVHHSEIGATSTFHEINWNAFKAKGTGPYGLVASGDRNQSYMETDPQEPHVPGNIREGASDHQNKYLVDYRHPDQLNLFSDKTVAEHKEYEGTPGALLHMSPEQFDTKAFDKDPTTKVIRRAKEYHERIDVHLGTVH